MHIQVGTDDNVEGRKVMAAQVEATVDAALGRFAGQLTRVEVHLGDKNARRSGPDDKRCVMEARPAGQQPIAVTRNTATLEGACAEAAQKLARLREPAWPPQRPQGCRVHPGWPRAVPGVRQNYPNWPLGACRIMDIMGVM